MPPLTHDDLDKCFCIRADSGGLPANALWGPIRFETVVGGHVVTMGGVLAVPRLSVVI